LLAEAKTPKIAWQRRNFFIGMRRKQTLPIGTVSKEEKRFLMVDGEGEHFFIGRRRRNFPWPPRGPDGRRLASHT
jgi:hypothetical protein